MLLKTGLLCLTLLQNLGLPGLVRLQPYFSRILKALTSLLKDARTWEAEFNAESVITPILLSPQCANVEILSTSALGRFCPLAVNCGIASKRRRLVFSDSKLLPSEGCLPLGSLSEWPPPLSAGTSLTEADRCWPWPGPQSSRPGQILRRREQTGLSSGSHPSPQRRSCCTSLQHKPRLSPQKLLKSEPISGCLPNTLHFSCTKQKSSSK